MPTQQDICLHFRERACMRDSFSYYSTQYSEKICIFVYTLSMYSTQLSKIYSKNIFLRLSYTNHYF